MQSSFKVIKDTKVVSQGSKEIITQYSPSQMYQRTTGKNNEDASSDDYTNSYKFIEDAQIESENIIKEAQERAGMIQQQAYEEAYNAGYQEGQQRGYNDGYQEALLKVQADGEQIIRNAENTLNNAKMEYEAYLEAKKAEIISLALNIARHILKREVSDASGIDEMLIKALENSRNAESIIIRTNSLYTDNIKTKICDWKDRFAIKAEIFVLTDESMDTGYAVIEKNNGKILIDIDEALDNIREAIL